MKKLLLLLFPVFMCVILIACDFTSDNDESKNIESSFSNISETEDSSVYSNESSKQTESSNQTESSEASEISDESTDDIIEKTIDVALTLTGTDALNNAGFVVDSNFNMTVSVTVEGTKEAIENLKASDISATVDLSGVVESGNIQFLINFVVPDGITFKSASEDMATISISKKQTEVAPPADPDAYISNGIVISGTRGMEQFGGGSAAGEKTALKLNEFKKAVGDSVNVYILPAPIASAFYAPEKYPNSIKNHQNCFNGLKDALVNVKYVDVLGALSSHTDEDIYFRTDHHWQALGAYYAAEQLAKVAGTPFDTLSTYTMQSASGVVGSLYGFSKASVLKENPDTMVWYVPSREHTVTYYSESSFTNPKTGMSLFSSSNSYSKFIHGDSYTTHIQSNVGNGRKLLIFKDSFGNALAPFVLSSFEEVYIADYREFKLNAIKFIEEHEITDVCFAMAAFSVATSKRDYITKLINY